MAGNVSVCIHFFHIVSHLHTTEPYKTKVFYELYSTGHCYFKPVQKGNVLFRDEVLLGVYEHLPEQRINENHFL